jgi:hypothetical protein
METYAFLYFFRFSACSIIFRNVQNWRVEKTIPPFFIVYIRLNLCAEVMVEGCGFGVNGSGASSGENFI